MRHNHHNGLKTIALFAAFVLLMLGLGSLLSNQTGNYAFLIAFSAFGLVMTAFSYWNSDKVALQLIKAVPVSEAEAPALHAIVADLAAKAKLPMPRLYVAQNDAPNAFATGRSPQHAAVCCTSGILALLDERELRGVLAHELSHVANRDVLTASVAAALANVVATAGQILSFGAAFSRGRGLLSGLIGAMVATTAATAMRMAISRTREYDADEDGSRLTGDPLALASALNKLDAAIKQLPMQRTRQAVPVGQLMIANPFGPEVLLSSHPSVADRVRRLEQFAGDLGQR